MKQGDRVTPNGLVTPAHVVHTFWQPTGLPGGFTQMVVVQWDGTEERDTFTASQLEVIA